MLGIDIECHVKQVNEAVRVFSSLRVERVQLTLHEHSSSPRRRGRPQSDLCPRAIPHLCQRTVNPSARSQNVSRPRTCHSSLTGGTDGAAALSVPIASISSPQGGRCSSHPQLHFLSSSSIFDSTNATPSAPHHAPTDDATEEVESVHTRGGF